MSLFLDFETRSPIDIMKRGGYVYAEHPQTDALLASFILDDGPLRRWKRGEPCPADIRAHVEAGGTIHAHNAAFERLIWQKIMTPRRGWPKIGTRQFICTATTAAAMSLPRSLSALGAALGLKERKDNRGKMLMKIHSIPVGFTPMGELVWHPLADDPASLELYHQYCDQDVIAEREAAKRLIPLSNSELELYWINEEINDRGLRIDIKGATAALRIIEREAARIDADLRTATAGAVQSINEVAKLKAWMTAEKVDVDKLDRDSVEDLLERDDLPEDVRQALELRREGAKPSVKKIKKMLEWVCADGRVHGVYVPHGAGQTGRFSSKGLQFHNLTRPRKAFEDAELRLDILFGAISTGDPESLRLLYGSDLGRPIHLLSDAVRGFIFAGPGCEFVDADYSSIEGRVAAWIAGEEWKLEAFRAIDRGEGVDIYKLAAQGIYGIPAAQIAKPQRQVGKIAELALGFGGGSGALLRAARAARTDLAKVFSEVWRSAPEERRDAAAKRHAEGTTKKLPTVIRNTREAWLAAELIKSGWRAQHPRISASFTKSGPPPGAWTLLERAASNAVLDPGSTHSACKVSYKVAHGFLLCKLPSGRCLAYGAPRIDQVEAPWADQTAPKPEREKTTAITARGVTEMASGGVKWQRFPLTKGLLFNHAVQGSARDILARGMKNLHRAGHALVGHTHDETMIEEPIGKVSVAEVERLMCEQDSWTAGLPLKAEGWRGKRFRK